MKFIIIEKGTRRTMVTDEKDIPAGWKIVDKYTPHKRVK
jgi:uncharacterized protein YbdZ (MbtH family)